MAKKIFFPIIFFIILSGCYSKENSLAPSAPSPTSISTIAPAVARTQLAKPIITPTIGYIPRNTYNFLPSATPAPSATPTNIFSTVSDMDGYKDLVITLEKKGCFGPCPAYSLKIYGDGKGVYEGTFNVKVEGVRYFTLTKEQLSKLVNAFETTYYFSFKDYYAMSAFDLSLTSTSITFQGKSKAVTHYGWCLDDEKIQDPNGETNAAPLILCSLEHTIGEIVNIEQWTGN